MDAIQIELYRSIKWLLEDVHGRTEGHAPAYRMAIINADPELRAFFASVASAGPGAWSEERARVGRVVRPGEGYLGLRAVERTIPEWKSMGRLLLDAKAPAAVPVDDGEDDAAIAHGDPDAPARLEDERVYSDEEAANPFAP